MNAPCEVKSVILRVARELARKPADVERAVVIFEDGYVTPEITQHLRSRTLVPFRSQEHGLAVAIVHTHPLPRSAPSLADLWALCIMSTNRTPAYLATVYSSGEGSVVTIYIAKRRLHPQEIREIIRKSYLYELLNVRFRFAPEISEKQIREQHRILQEHGIVVERYVFRRYYGHRS